MREQNPDSIDALRARAAAAESRASAAEGALRAAKRWFEDEQSGPWQPILVRIDLALSGLPPLASEIEYCECSDPRCILGHAPEAPSK